MPFGGCIHGLTAHPKDATRAEVPGGAATTSTTSAERFVGIVCEPQSESSPVEATAPRPLKTTASSATFTLHAVFEIYRAFPQNVRVNQAQHQRNDVPVFFGAGERSPFSKLMPRIVAALRASGLTHVDSGVVPAPGTTWCKTPRNGLPISSNAKPCHEDKESASMQHLLLMCAMSRAVPCDVHRERERRVRSCERSAGEGASRTAIK
jgi:hypothetical protein